MVCFCNQVSRGVGVGEAANTSASIPGEKLPILLYIATITHVYIGKKRWDNLHNRADLHLHT